ncbi:HET-domain-containing protein, partial [Setomelanomma holmii]
QPYQYEALHSSRQIRLLSLAPDTPDALLQCSLVQVDLAEKLLYEAISYAWGDARDRKYVMCDEGLVGITRNLLEALEAFRYTSAPRYLWADAICINQQNMLEQNVQVQLMTRIYSGASEVLLWLGKEDAKI